MPGLVPGIHVWKRSMTEDVDGRDTPGHDDMNGFKKMRAQPIGISAAPD
jgi:hypothetical protein